MEISAALFVHVVWDAMDFTFQMCLWHWETLTDLFGAQKIGELSQN